LRHLDRDTVASHLAVKIAEKQAILELPSVAKRLEKCLGLMESEISVLQVEKRIRTRRGSATWSDSAWRASPTRWRAGAS